MLNNFMKCSFCLPVLFFLACLLNACGGQEQKPVKEFTPDTYKKPLEKVNKMLVKTEEEEINNFINRYGWKMNETGTGLRYMIYKNGSGVKAQFGKVAVVNYEVRLITGDVCYTSKDEGPKEILMGKSCEITGIEEGILLMKVGDKAKFIIPSHLAFGLLGDEKKIPKRATLIYDVELFKIK
jgi:FKBP-type peptidyl-prolyl cis-trans isomerase